MGIHKGYYIDIVSGQQIERRYYGIYEQDLWNAHVKIFQNIGICRGYGERYS